MKPIIKNTTIMEEQIQLCEDEFYWENYEYDCDIFDEEDIYYKEWIEAARDLDNLKLKKLLL